MKILRICTFIGPRFFNGCFSNFFKNIQAHPGSIGINRLGTGEFPGSNPGKGENFSVKIYSTNLNFLSYSKKNKVALIYIDGSCAVVV